MKKAFFIAESADFRGIFGPQVRGNTAEFSENSDSIRSMRIAVALATGADDGGASPAHVLAPPRPPMMRAHPSALPLGIRAVP